MVVTVERGLRQTFLFRQRRFLGRLLAVCGTSESQQTNPYGAQPPAVPVQLYARFFLQSTICGFGRARRPPSASALPALAARKTCARAARNRMHLLKGMQIFSRAPSQGHANFLACAFSRHANFLACDARRATPVEKIIFWQALKSGGTLPALV